MNYHYERIKALFGGKIVGAITVDVDAETGNETIQWMKPDSKFSTNGEGFMGLLIEMPNGSKLGMIIMQDEEGNGPGAFDIIGLKMPKAVFDKLLEQAAERGGENENYHKKT